jgi:hypothetical protein
MKAIQVETLGNPVEVVEAVNVPRPRRSISTIL